VRITAHRATGKDGGVRPLYPSHGTKDERRS
jgi:hypothetical protein